MIQFQTETGSTYEVDPVLKRMRRLGGTHAPTRNQRADGEWRAYCSIGPIRDGKHVLVVWGTEPETPGILRRTLTSVVKVISHSE